MLSREKKVQSCACLFKSFYNFELSVKKRVKKNVRSGFCFNIFEEERLIMVPSPLVRPFIYLVSLRQFTTYYDLINAINNKIQSLPLFKDTSSKELKLVFNKVKSSLETKVSDFDLEASFSEDVTRKGMRVKLLKSKFEKIKI